MAQSRDVEVDISKRALLLQVVIADDRPVKLTVELPASIYRDLVAYGQVLACETGQGAVEPAKLIAPMLQRFMSTDRAFAKLRRGSVASGKGE